MRVLEGREAPGVRRLVDKVEALLASLDVADLCRADLDLLVRLLGDHAVPEGEWRAFAHFDTISYTRNLISHSAKYSLIVLCWPPGSSSPIHDHAGSHCIMHVLAGRLEEQLYERAEGGIRLASRCTVDTGETVYIHDKIGLHSVGNPDTSPAVSLHLYTPPISACHTFCAETGEARRAGIFTFYSIGGTLIHKR